jgi:rubrerythrin
LGVTPLVIQLGLTEEQTNGHWCSRCEGIWFGYTLEAQCPVCGNRNG